MPILSYTTKVDAHKTLWEIQQLLSKKGAKKIIIDNNDAGQPIALTFLLEWNNILTSFSLPCNFIGVQRAMKKAKAPKSLLTEEQALRVGWRIIKTWVEAQMAIIEAEVASMAEVFLPYAVTKNGTRLFEELEKNQQKLLDNNS